MLEISNQLRIGWNKLGGGERLLGKENYVYPELICVVSSTFETTKEITKKELYEFMEVKLTRDKKSYLEYLDICRGKKVFHVNPIFFV